MRSARLDAVVTLDVAGRILDITPAAAKLLDLTPDRARGQPLLDLLDPLDADCTENLTELLCNPARDAGVHGLEVERSARRGVVALLIQPTGEPPQATVWLSDVSKRPQADMAPSRQLTLMRRAERVAQLGSWEWRSDAGDVTWSDNLYRLFGMQPGEITPTPAYVLEQTHREDRASVAVHLASLGTSANPPPIEYRIVQEGRATRRLRSTVMSVEQLAGGATSVVGAVQDVTDEVGADRKIAAHIAVADALAEWESLERGGMRLAGDLAMALDFATAALWVPAEDELVARVVWPAQEPGLEEFASATRGLRLRQGACLPGRVWRTGEAINVLDVRNQRLYSRRDEAKRARLRGAVALPALHAHAVLAVIELHSRESAKLSLRLMRSLTAIGYEVGQFLAHRRAELHPLSLTPRQLEVLRLAAHGCSAREIAEQLSISPTTVKTDFENLYAKLGVSDRAAAVAAAMRHGLIE